MITLNCSQCHKDYQERPYRAGKSKYCSRKCYGFSSRGRIPASAWKKGQTVSHDTQFKAGENHQYFGKSSPALGKKWRLTAETKRRMSRSQTMRERTRLPVWQTEKPGYDAVHFWVIKQLGKPRACSTCGKSDGNLTGFHWANKSGTYLRDLSDWIRLCAKCHKAYDSAKIACQ